MKNKSRVEYINNNLFRTSCHCLSPEHNLTIEVEYDKKAELVIVTFNDELDLKYRESLLSSRWEGLKYRLQLCYKILRNKPIDFNGEFIFRGFDHIKDFCDMLLHLANKTKRDGK